MADILIRMEMPKGCKSCKLSSDSHCNATGQWLFSTDLLRSGFNWKTCRLPDCPLVELPEHGDLIDRDAFNAFICKSCGDRCNCESIETDCISCESAFRCDFVPLLKTAPVIVPSSKEETE